MSKGEYRDSQYGSNRRQTLGGMLASSSLGGNTSQHGKVGGGDMECGEGGAAGGGFLWSLGRLERWGTGSDGSNKDDDFVDRLNYRVSGLLMFLFISIISVRQYVGKPIQCWIPQEFTRGWEEYSENYCWVASTYYAALDNRLPSQSDRRHRIIGYYQWAPIILAMQGCMFWLPYLIWRLLVAQSEFNLPRLVQNCALDNVLDQDPDGPSARGLEYTAKHIDLCIQRCKVLKKVLSNRTNSRRITKCPASNIPPFYPSVLLIHGNFLLPSYCLIKLMYLTNILVQLCFMESIFGSTQSFFGIRILADIIRGRQWIHSGNFPRVTFCDLEAKKLGKNHIYTLQCVLPMNMFLEKIYIFLWFWLIIIGLVTIFSLAQWLTRLSSLRRRVQWVRRSLVLQRSISSESDRTTTQRFVKRYLQIDGIFLLHMVAINRGEFVAGALIGRLWDIYRYNKNNIGGTDLETDDDEMTYKGSCHIIRDKVIRNTFQQSPSSPQQPQQQSIIATNNNIINTNQMLTSSETVSLNANNNQISQLCWTDDVV